MMLELHNVTIGQQIRGLSATVGEGKVLSIMGSQGKGKTTLLRALMGFLAVDEGHISIDGELLTPLSAPWFRKQMAYVPQYMEVPEGFFLEEGGRRREKGDNSKTLEEGGGRKEEGECSQPSYLWLLERAVKAGKALLFVDEPRETLSAEDAERAERLISEAAASGATVVAVNFSGTQNQIQL